MTTMIKTTNPYSGQSELLTEEEHKKRTSKSPCQGKVVEIDGIKYKLEEYTP